MITIFYKYTIKSSNTQINIAIIEICILYVMISITLTKKNGWANKCPSVLLYIRVKDYISVSPSSSIQGTVFISSVVIAATCSSVSSAAAPFSNSISSKSLMVNWYEA